MVSSLVAGTNFGMVLLWAVVLGAILKYFLTEGIGRWYMASGQTILQGWRSLGRWAIWYFVIYLFIVTFVYSQRVASEYRNRLVSNVVLAVSVIPFIVVGVQEVLGSL